MRSLENFSDKLAINHSGDRDHDGKSIFSLTFVA